MDMGHGARGGIGMGSTTTTTTFIGQQSLVAHAFAVAVSGDDSNETTASSFIATTILGDSIETSNCSNFNANSLTQNRTEQNRTETEPKLWIQFMLCHF